MRTETKLISWRCFWKWIAPLFLFLLYAGSVTSQGLWSKADFMQQEQRKDLPAVFRSVVLNVPLLQNNLAQAPLESAVAARNAQTIISLPMPDGSFMDFRFVESPVMEPGLAAKFPDIKTYIGTGLNDPSASVRFGWTMWGFHAVILTYNDQVFIEPYIKGNTTEYIIYSRKDVTLPEIMHYCEAVSDQTTTGPVQNLPEVASGTQLRTYRLGVAASGEYSALNGGTVASVIAAITAVINQVDAIYEREVAIRFVLITDNDKVIFFNTATDYYTNTAGSPCSTNIRTENQNAFNDSIGDANYDMGHLFTGTNIGGCASFSVVCSNGSKARGVSGVTNGGAFDVGLTCHEMGHQFSAQHTFNSNSGSCAGAQYAAGAAYEPGSGSTIMSYAGSCHIIQNSRDMFFHTKSYEEIITFTTGGGGNSCPVTTATGNSAPTVNAGAGGFTIPINTPFILNGSGSDPDGDPLTYSWEEFDLGPTGDPQNPSGTAPIFRSFPPVAGTSRTFPQISDILNNTQTIGELLPSYGRAMNFRLTARDGRANGGGVEFASMSFTVDGGSGPFAVTSPNTAVSWCAGETKTITWDVANTNNAPVNTANVNILLSTDGGNTFPVTILANTPNDGTEDIVVPNNPVVNNARIKVEAAGNVYFDISNANFTINAPPSVTLDPVSQDKEFGDNVSFTAAATGSPAPTVQWQISEHGGAFADMPGETSTTLSLTCLELLQDSSRYRAVFTNLCGTDTTAVALLTVSPRTTTATVTIEPNPQQYSDTVTFYVKIENAVICGEQAATGGTVYVGTQNMGTVTFSISGLDLIASLAAIPLLEPSPFGTPPTGNMAPGDHLVTVVFDSVNTNFNVSTAADTLTIEPEDARAYYTGACFASTLNANTSNAVVTLAATFKDISAVLGDAAWDTFPGDIRNATISFINRDNNTIIADSVPFGLVDPNDPTVAVAVYNWNVTIAGNSQSFTIGIIIGGYYIRNSSEDNTIVTVSKPLSDFVTGGGYINLNSSAGLIAGDDSTKMNFGFSVKFNKKGNQLQGAVNNIVRRTETDGLHSYQIKGNSFTSLAVLKTTVGGSATINSKANITDVTDPSLPVAVTGNGVLQIKLVDNGQPGTTDSIAVTIWDKYGGLWFASNWDGTRTIKQVLDGGNLTVNSNKSFRVYDDFSDESLFSVYPNPSSGQFMLSFLSDQNSKCVIRLVDNMGKNIMSDIYSASEGVNTLEYSLDHLSGGIYYLILDTDTDHQVFKVFIN